MSEAAISSERRLKMHYRGRGGQVIIYLGKLMRGFIYQADWKVMPMAALIAGLVSMVVRRDFFVTMEGTLKGAFALTCVSIWNGCFNSIQVVCREREIIKREHRSGLHISAYIFSHMVYQAFLCLLQTAITMFVCKQTGIKIPDKGLFTRWLIADIGITIFLISYASDMLSLWVSCVTRSTTTAMTVMPFILIFQLVFSGGIFALPKWADKFTAASISNYGFKCITAQSNYNGLPLVTAWNSLIKVENQEINTSVTLGQVLDLLQNESAATIRDLRASEFTAPTTEQLMEIMGMSMDVPLAPGLPSLAELTGPGNAEALQQLMTNGEITAGQTEEPSQTFTFGEVINALAANPYVQEQRGTVFPIRFTIGDILEIAGRDRARVYIQEMTAASNRSDDYENSRGNIITYWVSLGGFIVLFAVLSVIFLEFVDKDKR